MVVVWVEFITKRKATYLRDYETEYVASSQPPTQRLDSRLLQLSWCFTMSSFAGKGEKTKGKGGGKGSKTKGAGNDAQKVLLFSYFFSRTLYVEAAPSLRMSAIHCQVELVVSKA